MRVVVAHGPVEELDHTAEAFELVEQEHLVDVFARKTIWGGQEYAVDGGAGHRVAQRIEAGAPQSGATVALVTEHVLALHLLSLRLDMGTQALGVAAQWSAPGIAVGSRRGHTTRPS